MSSQIRVLVVDDSALMRTLISDLLAKDDDIDVIDTARDGEDALSKIASLDPDVLTLDIEMPRMNGLELLMELEGRQRPQVIVLSGVTDPEIAYQSLQMGAVDFVLKPSGTISVDIGELGIDLRDKVRAAASVCRPVMPQKTRKAAEPARPLMPVVAIAASTGGPMALETVLAGLPGDLDAAVAIVQHLPPGFSRSLVRRLDRVSELDVVEVVDGMTLRPGKAYVAPTGSQLRFAKSGTNKCVKLTDEPGFSRFIPSADVMLASLGEIAGSRGIGVILTGMGSDGLRGMTELNRQRGHTIAQDRESCVVYGMPKACVEAGVIDEVLPLAKIAARVAEVVRERGSGNR